MTTVRHIGLDAFPYLADHGFQDMVVLPGALYVDLALRVSRELFGRAPRLLRNLVCHHPIILSGHDTAISVEVRKTGEESAEFGFYEAHVDGGSTRTSTRQCAATLDVCWSVPAGPSAGGDLSSDVFSVEAFQARSDTLTDGKEFYRTLRENGNQYGPRFQHVSSIWRAGDESLARLSVACQHADTAPQSLHASVLDSMTQLMAPFLMETGKTVILQSIDIIDIRDVAFPGTVWGHATLLTDDDHTRRVGNVRVFDESDRTYVALSGVVFRTLDRPGAADANASLNLVVASNFTAEPLEEGLKFWGDHFGVTTHVEFAPYNQIFQQLLDGASACRRNVDGVNVILLALEEWAAGDPRHRRDPRPPMTLDVDRAARCFGNRERYVLPNGLEIVHLNQHETDYVYREIFEDGCYLRHGIRLQDGDVVVDIGANIGLFSLFVLSRCARPQIYAFEPAPAVYELLKANCAAYGSSVRTSNVGVSDKPGAATLTFYEASSVFSSFHANEADDREAVQTVVRNALNSATPIDQESVEACVTELTADRLRHSTHRCRLTSVSEIIRENQLDRINLLKIDAEKSELDIISGIEDHDWPKIDQIVIEIHDRRGEVVPRVRELLNKRGYRCEVEQETLLQHSGLFNLYAVRIEARASTSGTVAAGLEGHVRDFAAALRSFVSRSAPPLIVCICPRTPAAGQDADLNAALEAAERTLLSEAGMLPTVHTISSTSLSRFYPVLDYYDPHGHQLGHVPYTADCFAAIATALVRAIFSLNRHPFKVIVLDCDNTLWKGVCGEDGPMGIEITPHHRALQQFMLDQMHAGMLLCLCSKNNERDVLDVFDHRPDMVLRPEHIVSRRIDWNSKSAHITSLAKELGLGLDSFIFVDDNPVDCADVSINCAGVLTLQLPPNPESFLAFLNHIWAFDRLSATHEDRNRTRVYREHAERREFREHALSLKEFVTGLQLRVEVAEATDDRLGRVSQLTFRTNQFNVTSIRRSEEELRRFMNRSRATCLVVRVVDRFGDYGLVGAIMYETTADRYKVDTFLLSCRVLGRGVEHAVLSQLGQRAVREDKRWIELTYLPTNKNVPAFEFLASIGNQYRNEAGTSWTFPAERLARLRYDPDEQVSAGDGITAPIEKAHQSQPASGFGALDRPERLQRIGEFLYDVGRISKSIDEHRLTRQPVTAVPDFTPGSTLEISLATIWRTVLGRPRIGLHDNFFEVGGTSLKAVQVVAAIRTQLKQSLSIVGLFECPTVALLAARLQSMSAETSAQAVATDAALRGQRRRDTPMRRRAC